MTAVVALDGKTSVIECPARGGLTVRILVAAQQSRLQAISICNPLSRVPTVFDLAAIRR